MKIDFEKEQSEASLQKKIDKFYTSATPKWFEWMGWLLILGALTYISRETGNIALTILTIISYVLMSAYFQSYFYRFEFKNIPFVKRWPASGRAFSYGLSAIVGTLVYFLIILSVTDIKN